MRDPGGRVEAEAAWRGEQAEPPHRGARGDRGTACPPACLLPGGDGTRLLCVSSVAFVTPAFLSLTDPPTLPGCGPRCGPHACVGYQYAINHLVAFLSRLSMTVRTAVSGGGRGDMRMRRWRKSLCEEGGRCSALASRELSASVALGDMVRRETPDKGVSPAGGVGAQAHGRLRHLPVPPNHLPSRLSAEDEGAWEIDRQTVVY